ncbi:MAG: putative metal-dependent hydrolase [Bryobacterales bacterium]|nr:putative metal-dependent hydrolase [Bryobacterales bacterium]
MCAVMIAAAVWAASCARPTGSIDRSRLIDLSYSYNAQTVYWPNAAEGFQHQKDTWKITPQGYWYAAGNFSSAEHGGTHMDAPIHFGQGKTTVDKIPVSNLIGTAEVVDVTEPAARDRDYRVSAQDLTGWEQAHGAIAPGSIVLIRTGWGKYWPDKKQYLGSDVPGDTAHLHFPGLSRESAELLVQRGVAGVGIDTASMDYGPSQDFIVHQVVNKADVYGLENVANLERLPATGTTLIALPMKIEEGSGAPVRIVAILP